MDWWVRLASLGLCSDSVPHRTWDLWLQGDLLQHQEVEEGGGHRLFQGPGSHPADTAAPLPVPGHAERETAAGEAPGAPPCPTAGARSSCLVLPAPRVACSVLPGPGRAHPLRNTSSPGLLPAWTLPSVKFSPLLSSLGAEGRAGAWLLQLQRLLRRVVGETGQHPGAAQLRRGSLPRTHWGRCSHTRSGIPPTLCSV